MIALMLAQLRARWVQALALLLVSAAVTAASVSATLYARAVDEATVAQARQDAGRERLVSFPTVTRELQVQGANPDYTDVLPRLSAFEPVTTTQIQVIGLDEEAPNRLWRLVGRADPCGRAVVVAGRCPAGSREAALPVGLAQMTGLAPGDQVELTPAVPGPQNSVIPNGTPETVTLTGVLEAKDPADPYWDAGLDPLGRLGGGPALITNRRVLETWTHGRETRYLEAVLPASALTPERIPELRAQLASAEDQLTDPLRGADAGLGVITELSALLDELTEQGNQARALLPIAAAPLVALCWLVVYLAVSQGLSARRHEVGLVALRGARGHTRAAVVAAESLAPVLIGAPVGVVCAHLLVALAGPAPVPVGLDGVQLQSAGVALAGAIVAALVALRRELATPVAQLLRRVPPRRRLAVAAAEVLAVALAVVVVADLRVFDRDLVGLAVAAPAVVMLAVAVLAARLVRPLIDLAGRWSLRRGRLGPAMAALYLARQPGAARLVVVLALVLGMLGFGMISADVAAQGRATDVARTLGAERVLTVQPTDPGRLLAAVRAADPSGRHAMAVAGAPGDRDTPPRLAVDSTRLAQVATWSPRHGELAAGEVAALLRPREPERVPVGDGELVAELHPTGSTRDGSVVVSVLLAPLVNAPLIVAEFEPVTAAQGTYRTEVAGCEAGCRLAGVAATAVSGPEQARTTRGDSFSVTVHELALDGQPVLGGGWLADPDRWRPPYGTGFQEQLSATVVEDQLQLAHRAPERDVLYPVLAVDTPYPLPVVTAGDALPGSLVTTISGESAEADVRADLAGLPGLGDVGVLMDLEYADQNAIERHNARMAQVWLAEDAPAGIRDRLAEQGLVISGEQSVDDLLAILDRGGAAQALRFFLLAAGAAGLIGLLALSLVVAVDRRGWSQSVQQLRVQGLARRTAARAGRWSYGGIVLAAVLAGAVAALAAWLAAGDRLPLGVEVAVRPPWPDWPSVLLPWTVVVALLLVVAAAAGRFVRAERRT